MPCGLAYLVLVPIGMTWPSATMLPVAATALMGFGFAVLGISPGKCSCPGELSCPGLNSAAGSTGRGTKFPVLVLLICAGVCVVFEPVRPLELYTLMHLLLLCETDFDKDVSVTWNLISSSLVTFGFWTVVMNEQLA